MQRIVASLRLVLVLVMALSVLGFSASTVLADAPYSGDYVSTATLVVSWCSFPITMESTYTFKDTVYFKEGGVSKALTHVWEQDVYSANGKSIIAPAFRLNIYWEFDAEGNLIHEYVSGQAIKIPLPDGSTIYSAGRTDFLTVPEGAFFSPDRGRQIEIDGLCAALAP